MKKLLIATILGTSLTLGAANIASDVEAYGRKSFKTTATLPANTVKINVSLSDDLIYRANHLSKDIRHRSHRSSLRDGFAGHGFYGDQDLEKLTDRLKRKMEKQLTKQGIEISESSGTVLNLVLTDVSPNRPTFRQMSAQASLSYRSFGIGGAEFTGTLIVDGKVTGEISYAWFESDIRDARYGGTWSDTHRAIDLFSKKTAKSLR